MKITLLMTLCRDRLKNRRIIMRILTCSIKLQLKDVNSSFTVFCYITIVSLDFRLGLSMPYFLFLAKICADGEVSNVKLRVLHQ